jgi:hypothetical protein
VPKPLFLVDYAWTSVGNLKLVRPNRPNGCTVATLTRYQGLNEFQIELSCKIEKAYVWCSKNSQILHAARLEDKEQLSLQNQVQMRNIILIKNYGSRTVFNSI